jgi:hypothetical protein
MFRAILAMSIASFFGFAQARDFLEGQVWSYKTRPGEGNSTLLINKVEIDPRLGAIFHVSVSGVSVKNSRVSSGVTSDLPHFPVSKQTLELSCVNLVGKSPPNAEYREGYAEWRSAFNQGKAGIFSIPISEIIDGVETAINQ